jgi:hypothetical protein
MGATGRVWEETSVKGWGTKEHSCYIAGGVYNSIIVGSGQTIWQVRVVITVMTRAIAEVYDKLLKVK